MLLEGGRIRGTMEKLGKIKEALIEIYGETAGLRNFEYLQAAVEGFFSRAGFPRAERKGIEGLDGKVFAICYPDNVYNDAEPTLTTLENALESLFPDINGIHILPERRMSHDDVWAQDLLHILTADAAADLVSFLTANEVLTSERTVSSDLERDRIESSLLPSWYADNDEKSEVSFEEFKTEVVRLLEGRYNSHFNDGGFSQITRAEVDPRFGTVEDLRRISSRYALMLDFVVNHLDIDNGALEAFRRGEDDGSAFLIIDPSEYERLKGSGEIGMTFRPRPFPLFTGLRRYPKSQESTREGRVAEMNRHFEDAGLDPLDGRVVEFLSLRFKVKNDQGLTAEDLRVFDGFLGYLGERHLDPQRFFADSEIQPGQKAFTGAVSDLTPFCENLGIGGEYADVFETHDDAILGEKFYVYTTFSESQVDINPVTPAGFKLLVDDLFHLLGSGQLAMMRMDAIKYLWKEIGKKNFDMPEGNRLIEVIRSLLEIAAPSMVPLDEINSPDPVVYQMGRNGGFAYLFGQVNAVPVAFNTGSLEPIRSLYRTMSDLCPESLVLFVMLSTHDGRSVQGLGVDRIDGHVRIMDFAELKAVVEAGCGKTKYRSVPSGKIPADTLRKACDEIGTDLGTLDSVFTRDGESYSLSLGVTSRRELALRLSAPPDSPVVEFLSQWLLEGRTAYELCCTSRDAFVRIGSGDEEEEARRLALAQIFILSFGQSVPAIYFNDLLGLGNDMEGYKRSGKPRDLNRHKSHIDEIKDRIETDPFTQKYVNLANSAIRVRSIDPAFYPGSRDFEFVDLTDTIFLNHAFARDRHALVIGNILGIAQEVCLELSSLCSFTPDVLRNVEETGMTDALTGNLHPVTGGSLTLSLPAYGALWLVPG